MVVGQLMLVETLKHLRIKFSLLDHVGLLDLLINIAFARASRDRNSIGGAGWRPRLVSKKSSHVPLLPWLAFIWRGICEAFVEDPTILTLSGRHVCPSWTCITVKEVAMAEVWLVLDLYLWEALLIVACIHDRHRWYALPVLATTFRMEGYVAADSAPILGDLTIYFPSLKHLRRRI